MKERILNGLNTFLVWNTFFVLISFIWFVAALIGKSTHVPLGLDLWMRLWDPLFTPAIGLLMAGAMVSGLSSWVMGKLQKS
ncbi:hypothetical protein [Lyngbya confervoides]|uniref:Uncharacterized protein n=1 Tax=Lyngbya confervoides BDU141951 TaxID=1574623 RepID=A0ABD4TA04_9CYAN|nr:hypothetical protein [Lyngbya confervoides]MCM1985115.1 hypothetical protein [Lyngbya confervoides BDU141951]